MQQWKQFLVLTASLWLTTPAFAQFPGPSGGGGGGVDEMQQKEEEQQRERRPQQDDATTPSTPPEAPEMPPTELDLPVDTHIKVKLEPYVAGAVVDRIIEPSVIVVESPNSLEVEVFVVPVDAPYGGKAIEKPHLIGHDDTPANGFKINWAGKEKSPYVKVFVVATKRTGLPHRLRSHTLDFGMGGNRFDGVASPKQAPTTANGKKP